MATGFEKLRTDTQLQNHWIRRFIAMLIDALIAWIVSWVIALILSVLPWGWGVLSFFIFGVIWFLYASFAESSTGWTLGKQILKLKVTTVDGRIPTIDVALVRNVSKVFWPLYLLDVIVGLATLGDPTQKYTDRIAGTVIVSVAPTTATSATSTPSFTPIP